uniref:PKD domain-containing protein n=1 Tax=Salinibacterium sp. TaxID=1915057 RepID=UPI00286D0BC4
GPVYRYDADLKSDVKWPEYWDGKALFGEWNQGKMYSFQLNESTPPAEATAVVDINRILPGIFDGGPKWHRSMDFTFGPDGALYIIDWGSDFGGSTADSGVFKVDYVKGSSSPIARASADVTSGPATSLTVAFSSAGTRHPLSLDYSLQWNFGDGSATSAAENPTHTYTAAGEYTAQLTVTDILGKTAVANVKIVVGNALPAVTIDFPENGGFFEWGDQVAYEVTVSDPDSAGAIDCSKVRVLPALGHDSHNHDFGELSGCKGTIQTIRDAGHGLEANLFWVINVSYTDDGGAAQVPLTGFGTNVLNPQHFQAEYFDSTGRIGGDGGANDGVKLEATGDVAGGGRNLSYVDANDFWSYEPVNLVGIDSITLRTASGYSGSSTIEARWGSETGPAIGSVVTSPTLKNGSPDWQTYSDFEMSLDTGRPTGSGKLFFVSLNGGVNVNSMVFVGDGVQSNTRPEVDLTVDSDSGVAPHTVTAIAAATDPDGNTAGLTWQWDRGDGNGFTPGAMTERFDYLTAGIHKLIVRVTDEGGAYTDVSKTITVTDPLTGICLAGRSDGFDGTSLDTGRWNRNVRTNQFLTVEGGGLVIPASLTDLHAAGTGTPNLVLQDLPSGAFTATAKVNFPARLMYQQAGLIIYGDDDNYLKLVNMARGGTSDASNRVFQFLKETGAVPVETNTAPLGVGFPDTFYVRLVSDGTTLTAQYSADGTNYTSMETTNGLSGMVNPRIGLLALGSTSTAAAGAPLVNATFDWFQVTPDDTVPASTPGDEFDGTALDYCRWSVVNENSSGYRVQDGSLRIDTSPFDIYGADSGVENFVVQAQPAGDWIVETRVDASAFDRRYQQGGLILYGDDSNYLKLDILATNAAGSTLA